MAAEMRAAKNARPGRIRKKARQLEESVRK
jgi:hypothetical protein